MAIARLARVLTLSAACFLMFLTMSQAATYDEAVDGDLSDIPASPTPWLLDLGANRLTGSAYSIIVEIEPGVPQHVESDYDLVSFTIPAGLHLDSIIVDSYVNVDQVAQSFVALQEGSPWQWGFGWDLANAILMGHTHLQSYMPVEKTNILMDIHNVYESFELPLPSGIYTMLLEDIDSHFTYSLIFNVSAAVPEPSSALLSGFGLALLAVRRRGRR